MSFDVFINAYARIIEYCLSDFFIPVFFAIMLVLAGMMYLLKNCFKDQYDVWFDYKQTTNENVNLWAVLFFVFSLLVYIVVIYCLDGNVFSNHDSMHDSFVTGTRQQYGFFKRLNPLVFVDLAILYGITHNYFIINLYVVFVHLVLMGLLYRLYDMIPASKRLLILGVVALSSSYFWTNHIVFVERLSLIYICASLLCLRNWVQTKKLVWIFFFLFWMNVASYTKETNLLLYIGFVVVLFFRNLYHEKITISTFAHPLKTIKQFPLEFLAGLSILFFVIQYVLIVHDVLQNRYLESRYGSWIDILYLYKIELLIIFISATTVLKASSVNKFIVLTCWMSVFSIVYVLGYLKLMSIGWTAGRSYYIAVPMVFILIGWLGSIKSNRVFSFFVVLVLLLCGVQNYKIFINNTSAETLAVAKFLSSQPNASIMLGKNFKSTSWYCECWPIAFKTMFSQKNIYFKSAECKEDMFETALSYGLKAEASIASGDYYVVLKDKAITPDIQALEPYKTEQVFHNKFYDVYKILN